MDPILKLFFRFLLDDPDGPDDPGQDEPGGAPPGSPPTHTFEGPWFQTQMVLASSIGITSFLIFSYARTRWPLLFAPRTKLKGFSPHESHAQQGFFGWILPTIRTSEFTVLQIVGLDAAVLLNFYKMSFYLFSLCSLFAAAILMPINLKSNISNGGDDADDDWPIGPGPNISSVRFPFISAAPTNGTQPGRDWLDLISDANSYLSVHLLFTYLFTLLSLYFIYKNYKRFIRARQLFSLELVHSIPARTVMITQLPAHLRGERALAEYFEGMDLAVESVSVCREVGSLKRLIDARTRALLKLEKAWVDYVGNPSTVESYDPAESVAPPLVDVADGVADAEAQRGRVVVPHRPRPTIRVGWFGPKVDALEYLETKFKEADEAVRKKRRTGKFKATQTAFVTFEKMSSAQIAVQTATASTPFQCKTHLAPEPRDIVWSSMSLPQSTINLRDWVVVAGMGLLLFTWIFPITALSTLLSYKEIQKVMPWLARLIERNDNIRAVVQNSLPSVAMVSLNALLPFLLEALTYMQGFRARSWVEYSLMKKYFLFLLTTVVFIFLLASTYWQLVRELANSPARIPEKLAQDLSKGRARHFFLSYVILQGMGLMPLQLLNLGVAIPYVVRRALFTRTPRDFAELNAPPMINYGVVYPQAMLIFIITLLYSVIQPLILFFGALYFGVAYVVYKYKLLFVFYKPYESQGQAWPITFVRLIWGVVMFLVFMTGIFTLRKAWIISSLLLPLLGGTVVWSWYISKEFEPLSKYVSLSSVNEVQRGEDSAEVLRLKAGHPVTWSQSNLHRRRYAQHDETLYVAPEDDRTDYSQPPMANWYPGVLNTGKRRYGHPALNGVLPQPWLPLKKGQTLVNGDRPRTNKIGKAADDAVVLTLRRRPSTLRRASRRASRTASRALLTRVDSAPAEGAASTSAAPADGAEDTLANPWGEDGAESHLRRSSTMPNPLHHRLSFDDASGVIMLPEGEWLDQDESSDSDDDLPSPGHASTSGSREPSQANDVQFPATETQTLLPRSPSKRYGTYYHHPERRRTQTMPGTFA
ncbi:DUF221-domain-containing protein [Punctularia strigosozonata HHB-11173 SS5]|uniref:DUF221-domain-containing protein n=1 Tax=Punctularia strigosozonata (strain HHB-11173) TaxID=741275 RepID=R7S5H2_PUNST|nr:DUF221-domain-containing protein [Punctularia strigosozonata HHB-11173 SS5]EIN04656.1 DUF221-domain-containing protein [Punctularia strigosozonata HHB-11173 SS5]